MIILESKVEELYTKGGKELSDLIQEWMDENNFSLYCRNEKNNVEYYGNK